MAPETPLYSFQVLNSDGSGQMSDVIAALEWILVYGAKYDIRVVNMSLGKGVDESASLDPLVQASEALVDAGFVVVASAGNYGEGGPLHDHEPGHLAADHHGGLDHGQRNGPGLHRRLRVDLLVDGPDDDRLLPEA